LRVTDLNREVSSLDLTQGKVGHIFLVRGRVGHIYELKVREGGGEGEDKNRSPQQ